MIRKEDVYRIGRIGKPHGIKGEVNFMFEDDVFDRTESDYIILSIDEILVPFFMEEYRFKGEASAIVKFCDIDTQQRASELTGCEVYFPRAKAEAEEEMSWAALVGYALVDGNTDKEAGRISHIDETTANLLFELDNGLLIPASPELVRQVNIQDRKLIMDIPEGLLDL